MDDAVRTAIRCFQENRRDFGDPQVSPEKFNLYNGLANLAEAVGTLQDRVNQLTLEVQQLRRQSAAR
jgi:X-X-X-Leu-X-X-Gly heptad repeat protein